MLETALVPAGIVSVSSQGDLYDGLVEAGKRAARVGGLELRVDVPGVAVLLPEDALRGGFVDRARIVHVQLDLPGRKLPVEGESGEVRASRDDADRVPTCRPTGPRLSRK